MRNYVQNRALSETAGPGPMIVIELVHNWRRRRQLAQSAVSHAADLCPGAKPEDILWALNLPLTVNPLLALEDRVFRAARQTSRHKGRMAMS